MLSFRESQFARFFEALCDLQKKHLLAPEASGSLQSESHFNLTESHILIELDSPVERTAKELSAIIMVEKSTISRAVASLVDRGLVQALSVPGDGRRKILKRTVKAEAAFLDLDLAANGRVEDLSKKLSREQIISLLEFLRLVNQAYKVPNGVVRSNEHVLRPEIRRLTRAVRLLGSDFMGSGVSSNAWQTLRELRKGEVAALASNLCEVLHVPANTMSSIVKALEEREYVERTICQSDKRSSAIKITLSGETLMQRLEKFAITEFGRVLGAVSDRELELGVDLFQKFCGEEPAVGNDSLNAGYHMKLIESEVERHRARSFLIMYLARGRRHLEAPEILIGKDSLVLCLYEGRRLRGIFEAIFTEHDQTLRVVNLVFDRRISNRAISQDFVQRAIVKLFEQKAFKKLFLCSNAGSKALLAAISLGAESAGAEVVFENPSYSNAA